MSVGGGRRGRLRYSRRVFLLVGTLTFTLPRERPHHACDHRLRRLVTILPARRRGAREVRLVLKDAAEAHVDPELAGMSVLTQQPEAGTGYLCSAAWILYAAHLPRPCSAPRAVYGR